MPQRRAADPAMEPNTLTQSSLTVQAGPLFEKNFDSRE
jgi:hypothetical protein